MSASKGQTGQNEHLHLYFHLVRRRLYSDKSPKHASRMPSTFAEPSSDTPMSNDDDRDPNDRRNSAPEEVKGRRASLESHEKQAKSTKVKRGNMGDGGKSLFAGWQRNLASIWSSSRQGETPNSEGDTNAKESSSGSARTSMSGEEAHIASASRSRRPMNRARSSSLPSSLDSRHRNCRTAEDEYEQTVPDTQTFVPPATLVRLNSTTPSLRLQASSREEKSRGYAWRRDSSGRGGFVPPSHRNPTGLQAFYDTHFGSSSNWRTIRRPFSGAFSMWNKHNPLSSRRKDNEKLHEDEFESTLPGANRGQVDLLPGSGAKQSQDNGKAPFSLLRLLPFSPGILGISSPPARSDQVNLKASDDPFAYEPELIPTTHGDHLSSYYFKKLEGNVVVLGGYRGSVLRDAVTRQMLWVPLKVGVGLRRPTLELGLSEEAEERSEELVVADDMLSEIGSMVDSGKRLIQRCSNKQTTVHSFGYDWRLSLGRSSERLEALLQRLWEESSPDPGKRRGAKVIAHSMGGLVALHALGRSSRPQIFESLVFASTPFLGTPNILGPLRIGDAAMFNDEICSPRATFTFRSTFYLLPNDPSKPGKLDTAAGQCFEEEDGTVHDVDFLSPDVWDELGFSPCVECGSRPKKEKQTGSPLDHKSHAGTDKGKVSIQSPNADKAENFPAFPGADVQMTTSSNAEESGFQEEVKEAVKVGQQMAKGQEDTNEALIPENRQKTHSKNEGIMSGEEVKEKIEDNWCYLERTLSEVRLFVHQLRTSFDEERFARGEYPPMAILTSGRTPTVRGALAWPREKSPDKKHSKDVDADALEQENKNYWKKTAQAGDYSRMLYAPGDGVILRRSSVAVPGSWSRCLVRGHTRPDKNSADSDDLRGLSKRKKYDEIDAMDLSLTSDEGTVETSHRHVTLLSDVDGIGRCLEACRRDRLARDRIDR